MRRYFPFFSLGSWNNRPRGLFTYGAGEYGPARIIRRNVTHARIRTLPKRPDGWVVDQSSLRSDHNPAMWRWRFARSRYRLSYAGIARYRKVAGR